MRLWVGRDWQPAMHPSLTPRRWTNKRLLSTLLLLFPAAALTQSFQPPRHIASPGPLVEGASPAEIMVRADAGMQIDRDRTPAQELDEHRKLDRALKALAAQRPGVIDAYVVSIAFDSDPVFGREARAAGDVLQRRFGAQGRTIVLAGTEGSAPSALPRGTPGSFGIVLARIAELMNEKEDALILYTTSHGAPFGLYYHDADNGYGAISPNRLSLMLAQLGISNRLLILSACYSGIFVRPLQSEGSAIVTAASSDRTSFGCAAENDWTYFGDAMINRALRKPQPLAAAFGEAQGLVAGWERQMRFIPSQPQIWIGDRTGWLDSLERRMPKVATRPTGRPAFGPAAIPPRR
ncbi:MAG TPA: C13 family peptidase [Allosphingosinicella sp.]